MSLNEHEENVKQAKFLGMLQSQVFVAELRVCANAD